MCWLIYRLNRLSNNDMTKQTRLTIEPMTNGDVPFAMELADCEGWGHVPCEYERKILLDPEGSFVARIEGAEAGIITTVKYGTYGFLGNLIVQEQHRKEGVGERLMRHAIAYLLSQKVRSIELDGVMAAVSLYRRLGFRDKYLSIRLFRPADENGEITPVKQKQGAASAFALDKRLTGIVRRHLLEGMLEDNPGCLITHGTPVAGYTMVRLRGGGLHAIGPLIAQDRKVADSLLSAVLGAYGDKRLWIGVPEPNYRMVQTLVARGFRYSPPSLRMYFGPRLDYEKYMFGICGPGVG